MELFEGHLRGKTKKTWRSYTPPYDLQIFVEDFPKEFSQDPPGCLPVASIKVRPQQNVRLAVKGSASQMISGGSACSERPAEKNKSGGRPFNNRM